MDLVQVMYIEFCNCFFMCVVCFSVIFIAKKKETGLLDGDIEGCLLIGY